jgi:hypothetical protein
MKQKQFGVKPKMGKIFVILFLVISSLRFAFAELDPRAYPTESEFDVYEYYTGTLDAVITLGERDAEEKVTKMTAEKFDISIKDIENIEIKFSALESELLKRDSEYKKGELIIYRWKKVKKLIDEIGWEEILKGY